MSSHPTMLPPMTTASTADASASSLAQLLRSGASARDIEAHLDGLPAAERLSQVLAVTGRGVKRLYEAVAGGTPPTLEELIPANARETVIYEGRNSLAAFSR